MAMYTHADKLHQLVTLKAETIAFIALLKHTDYADRANIFSTAIDVIDVLLNEGFTQGDLDNLANSFPRVLYKHKEWMPPDNPPPWWDEFEQQDDKIAQMAFELRVIGTL
jgi:hypothetical protein